MPILILEGPDGSGKSTLAKHLLKGTGYPTMLISRSGPPGNEETLEKQIEWLNELAMTGLNFILDRHPLISEAIYRRVLRGQDWPGWSLDKVYRAFRRLNHMILYCRPPQKTLQEGIKTEKQLEGVSDRLEVLMRTYDIAMVRFAEMGLAVRRFDWTEDKHFDIVTNNVRSFFAGEGYDRPALNYFFPPIGADDAVQGDSKRQWAFVDTRHPGGSPESGGLSGTTQGSPLDQPRNE